MKVVKFCIASLVLVGAAACSSSEDTIDSIDPTTAAPSTIGPASTPIGTEVPVTEPPTTGAPTTAPPPTETPATVAPTTTASPTTATTEPTTATTATTTTTILPAVTIEGIEVDSGTLFGFELFERQDSADVVDDISNVIGAPTTDTGFIVTPDGQQCSGSDRFRSTRWGDLRLTFIEDGEGSPDATQVLIAWAVGSEEAEQLAPRDERPAQVAPSGIVTRDGIGVGSTRADVRSLYGERALGSFDDDRVSIRPDRGADAISFTFDGDTVVGIGAGPLDCVAPDDDQR